MTRLSILKGARPYVAPVQAVEGEVDPRYPRNNRNQPEFGSVLLTLDHMVDSDGFHVHQKCVYSTETPSEALMSLMHDYYPKHGGPALNLDKSTFEILKQMDASPEEAIALYFVPVVTDRTGGTIVQVILSLLALQRLVAHPAYGNGSSLMAMNNLVTAVMAIAARTAQQVGGLPPLLLMSLENKAADRQAEQRATVGEKAAE